MTTKHQEPRLDKPWQEVSPGGVVTTGGNSETYVTGTWRTMRPVRDEEQCTQCLVCWIMCPDAAIPVLDGKVHGYDYVHCKGCGVCAERCPAKIRKPHSFTGEMAKVIQMVPESEFEDYSQ
ncbi:MAG: 4Fe-4S dicluster domain-containing protein [Anaerolineae bacterium]|jgi:pyruvate ferredoxin oxidoreductase delta subunit|nr:ferredoxin [Chloroflexota bacterium]